MCANRRDRIREALFRGDDLHLGNPRYLQAVDVFLTEMLSSDIGSGDLTSEALRLGPARARGRVTANAPGIAAGIGEYQRLFERDGIRVTPLKQDGEAIASGDTLLEIEGQRNDLLSHERTGLNVLQRMSGIASMTRRLQDIASRHNPNACVVATRKTHWGLLDKRAVHLGGGGTHRLGLWDAVLVKNNHLALLAENEVEAAEIAARRTWDSRHAAAFLEIEVRSRDAAKAAARVWRELQQKDGDACPCLLLLDNMSPGETSDVLNALRAEGLLDGVLTEASGRITEHNFEAYSLSGVDAISMGALTHSARALDLRQGLESLAVHYQDAR